MYGAPLQTNGWVYRSSHFGTIVSKGSGRSSIAEANANIDFSRRLSGSLSSRSCVLLAGSCRGAMAYGVVYGLVSVEIESLLFEAC